MNGIRGILLSVSALTAMACLPASGGTVYFNDFETPATATRNLVAGGTIAGFLATTTLPADNGGLSSANQSTWLGQLGAGVSKNVNTPETVTLSLDGLLVGSTYNVSFDLLIGSSWDGSANYYGPDEWSLTANSGGSSTLIDATFSNCGLTNALCGANSPQTYSDSTPLGGITGTTFAPTTGADFANDSSLNYGQDYAIYYMGHGAGNPVLNFVAGDTSATLVFQRTSGSSDSGDEYWALDNISVTEQTSSATPEPGTFLLFAAGAAFLCHRRFCRS